MIPKHYLKGGKKASILSIDMLKKNIEVEYALMRLEIKSLMVAKHNASQGKAFAQLLHDGATLKNGSKVHIWSSRQVTSLHKIERKID